MDSISYLIVPLLQGFEWFDEGLQASLQARGWPVLTRAESSVMIHVMLDITRPSDIARSMGVTRQAIHITLGQIIEKGVVALVDDPADKRSKVVELTQLGKAMRRDAQASVQYIASQLATRIGESHVRNLQAAFAKDWGAPVIYPLQPEEKVKVRRRQRNGSAAGAEAVVNASSPSRSSASGDVRQGRKRARRARATIRPRA